MGPPPATCSAPGCHAPRLVILAIQMEDHKVLSFLCPVPGGLPVTAAWILHNLMCQVCAEGSESPLMPATLDQTVPCPYLSAQHC